MDWIVGGALVSDGSHVSANCTNCVMVGGLQWEVGTIRCCMEHTEKIIDHFLFWLRGMGGAAGANPCMLGRRINDAGFCNIGVECLEGGFWKVFIA